MNVLVLLVIFNEELNKFQCVFMHDDFLFLYIFKLNIGAFYTPLPKDGVDYVLSAILCTSLY